MIREILKGRGLRQLPGNSVAVMVSAQIQMEKRVRHDLQTIQWYL